MPSAVKSGHPVLRTLKWALALAAVAFVAWTVPVRDRCWDRHAPATTRVSVSREPSNAGACVLHLRTGDVRIDALHCAELQCEPGVASTIAHAQLGVLSALLILYAIGTLAWAARWRALLRLAGIDMPLVDVWRVSIEAQAGGVILPGGIGGDAMRVASVATRRPDKIALVVASVLLDRSIGLAIVAAVAAALAFAWAGSQAGPLAFFLAALPVAFVAAVAFVRGMPLGRSRWLVEGRVGRITAPVLAYARDPRAPRAISIAAALSVVVAGVQFATIRGFVFALGGVPTAEKWIYLGTAMAFVVSALPGLPGSWGTADAAYVFFFGLAGVPAGTSLGVCLVYRLFWYLSGLVGAILQLAGQPRVTPVTPRD